MKTPEKTAQTSARRAVYAALLRGINVGGKNQVAMKDLVALFATCGCGDVRHYLQSGNIVFAAGAELVKRLPGMLSVRMEECFGRQFPVVLRSAEELAEVAANNPFLKAGQDPDTLHVAFLEQAPGEERAARLYPDRSPGDEFVVRGAEIYLYVPNGMAKTRLTNLYFDTKLETVSTMRNWNTVLKLRAMTQE